MASPRLTHSSGSGGEQIWESEQAQESVPLETLLEDFAENPTENPLRNSRMTLYNPPVDAAVFAEEMTEPEGCLKIAQHLMVDGAFNVNSTSVEVWKAQLAALRGSDFQLSDGDTITTDDVTPIPRLTDPVGEANNPWQGYRSLSDEEITELAENVVQEVRQRGPFLSLGEFVNRRISNDELGLKGALQAAIDNSNLNSSALEEGGDLSNNSLYERGEQENIEPSNTAVGIPGYLTQADVLKSLAPVITVRSDTFIVRAMGTSKNRAGETEATAVIEAVVQRVPEFVDESDSADTPIDELNRGKYQLRKTT